MSTKTYVGERLSNSVFISPKPSYLLYDKIGEPRDDLYRSRLGYPEHGSGPWLVARIAADHESPASTDAFRGLAIGGQGDGTQNFGYRFHDADVGEQWFVSQTNGSSSFLIDKRIALWHYVAIGWISSRKAGSYTEYLVRRYVEHWEWVGTGRIKYQRFPSGYPQLNYSQSKPDYALGVRNLAWCKANAGGILVHKKSQVEEAWISTRYTARLFVTDLTPPWYSIKGVSDQASYYLDTGILPGTWAMSLETAYIQAAKALPESTSNLAANIIECAELLSAIVGGRVLEELPKTARDAWLTYRYVYTTTKLDVAEAKSVFSRLDQLTQTSVVRTYGSYVRDGTTYRVGFSVDPAQIVPSDVSTTLQSFGLKLNALNVWDMIPYSFVVDWFLPISQIIEYFQDLGACRLEPFDLWWSILTRVDDTEIYVRLPGRKLSTLPYLDFRKASNRTIFMRIADSVALFT